MAIERLTEAQVARARPRSKPYRIADGGSLFLEVRPSGSKLWVMRIRRRDLGETMTSIGPVDDVSLADARDKARALRTKVAAGIDPVHERRREEVRARLAEAQSFESVYRAWIVLKKEERSPSYIEAIENSFNANILPRLGREPVADLSAPMILDALRLIERRGARELCDRTRGWIGQVIDYSIAVGARERPNPAKAIKQALSKHEGQPFKAPAWDSIGEALRRAHDYPGTRTVAAALELLIRCALRPGELRHVEQGDVDYREKLFTIPAARMKARRDHVVPLSAQALALCRELAELNAGATLLAPAPDLRTPLSEGTLAKAAKHITGDADATAHGFRSTFSTWAREHGFDRDDVELALAHAVSLNNAERAYARHARLPQRRVLMQAYSDALDRARDRRPATVTPMRRRSR